jgi:hypothetical protein
MLSCWWQCDEQPAAVTAIKPAPEPKPSPTTRNTKSHATTLLHQLVDPIREYWFVTPPEGTHANQLQGRPAPSSNTAQNEPQPPSHDDIEERKDELKDVEEVIVNVLITMPSLAASQRKEELRNQASSSSSRPTSTSVPMSSSRPTSIVTGHQSSEPEELPELVIGLAQFPLARPVVVEPVVDPSDNGNQRVSNGKEPLR